MLSFLLHLRYRYKQCDIQTSKFTAMSTSLIDFTSHFVEALYPTVDELEFKRVQMLLSIHCPFPQASFKVW